MATKKKASFVIRGMQRDLSVSKFNPEFSYENMNIRITARESNNLLSITNEKGNKELSITTSGGQPLAIQGKYVGSNILNNTVTLFTTDNSVDRIYRLVYDLTSRLFTGTLMFQGSLGFSVSHPIETLGVFENESIQKVYWVDGVNQPRVINIAPDVDVTTLTFNSFDFAQILSLDDKISVDRNLVGSGMFSPGVIQYAFSYFTSYGQETNIFHTSPLNYISHTNRGASPEDKISNSFIINMNKLDLNFKYIRIYSIHRTSIDATPTVKRLVDVPIQTTFTITETNPTSKAVHTIPVTSLAGTKIYKDGIYIPVTNYPSYTYTSEQTLLTYNVYEIPFDSNMRVIYEDSVNTAFNISIQAPNGGKMIVQQSGTEAGWQNVQIKLESGNITTYNYTINPNSTGVAQYVDSGTSGEIIDPAELLYKGSETITASTIAQKDNTLFLGNLKLKRSNVSETIKTNLRANPFSFINRYKGLSQPDATGYYPYINTLSNNSAKIKTFKYLEWYRIGIQFQHNTGKWSEPIWLYDKYNSTPLSTQLISKSEIQAVVGKYILDTTTSQQLIDLGYIRARGVISYPQVSDREVVAQGILAPTVYNVQDRYSNSPFAMSSWFIRPNSPFDWDKSTELVILTGGTDADWVDRRALRWPSIHSRLGMYRTSYPTTGTVDKNFDAVKVGALAEFRHNYPIPGNNTRRGEIQCLVSPPSPYLAQTTSTAQHTFVNTNAEYFYVDQSILTFHSPDIEFDNNVKNMDSSNLKLRIVGMVPITSSASEIDITTSTPQLDSSKPGFYKESIGSENISVVGAKGLISGVFWMDNVANPQAGINHTVGYAVYPWHRNGSLTNFGIPEGDQKRPAMLEKKLMSNIKYSFNSLYYAYNNIWKAYISGSSTNTGISGIAIFDSNEQNLVKIPAPNNSDLNEISYYGNIDKIVNITKIGATKSSGYPIMTSGIMLSTDDQATTKLFRRDYIATTTDVSSTRFGVEPCHIKYKSTPHAVLALNYTSSKAVRVLPTITDTKDGNTHNVNYVQDSNKIQFWDAVSRDISQDVISSFAPYPAASSNIAHGFLWLAELYNDSVVNRFGGQTEESFENNLWLPAGDPIKISTSASSEIFYTEGDTFYQRYDCLKTYPYTKEDQNSMVDIVSFMCETRVNIDGRYDRNRAQINNLQMSPTNFNLLNPVYSQQNNFFNYRSLNSNKIYNDIFQNSVTWTKTKTLGEFTDTWTNLTLASTIDLDGDKGPVNALRRFNNDIYAFQDKGISKILFNSRVQISASDGVPIEISNSYKVDGKIYITQDVGCKNKWSIVTTPSGLYFIDDLNSALYRYSGEFVSISDSLGFKTFMNDFCNMNSWDSETFKTFISHNDLTNGDVYFTNGLYTLGYSEMLQQFTSFYNYEATPLMFNIGNDFFAYKNNKLWEQFAGEYNKFYGVRKPYHVTFVANPEPTNDKIFDTLEFRADTWSGDKLLSDITFDRLQVWTEYQTGCSTLFNNLGKPSPLKKKFRIWRANIPRDGSNNRDRMRNPWMYVKLSMENPVNYKTELHDLVLYYFS